MKPSASTIQDDIPPVHVLEAAEKQERKETEDLLSGFDRPGRGPKAAPRERDFVDYYAKKPGSAGSGSGRAAGAPVVIREKARDVDTVIVRRKGDGPPAWMMFAGAAVLMLLVGGVVAYLATADGRPEAKAPSAGAGAASAATTLTGATAVKPSVADENIPPPSAASVVTAAASMVVPEAAVEPSPAVAPRGSAKREPRAGASAAPAAAAAAAPVRGTSTAEPSKAAPREDFIRDL